MTPRQEALAAHPAGTAAPVIRPMTDADLAAIVHLYHRVFPPRPGIAAAEIGAYLGRIFIDHPWRDPDLPTVICEDGAGGLAGVLGVMPRPMLLDGRPIRAAISHTYMVEPGSRGGMPGVALARAFLTGPQDLSIAEGGRASRLILERFGGVTAPIYSLRWTRPLRPGRYLLALLRRRGLPAPLSWALQPFAAAADRIAPWLRDRTLRLPRPRHAAEPLSIDLLLEGLATLCTDRVLRPVYDSSTVSWLLDLLERKRHLGTLRGSAVRDPSGRLLGWYLYYLKPGGIGEVVRIGWRPGALGDVLDHLFDEARRGGAVAVSGQVEPAALEGLSERGCLFHHDGGSWFLVHSRRPDVLRAVQRGDAVLTRLEGEWCVGF